MATKLKADIYPIYFFYGPEDYLIEEGIQKLLDQTLSQRERGLNLHLFNGEEHGSQEILRSAETMPMLSKYRVVMVNDADRMDKEMVKALVDYIKKPSASTCLILSGQTLGQWKDYRTEIGKVGKVVDCSRLKRQALSSWIKNRIMDQNKRLSEDALEYLIEVVGDHLHDLENALEKILLNAREKKMIELSDVEEITSEVKLSTIYDLTDAIGHQNLEKALGILGGAIESNIIPFKRDEDPQKKKDHRDVVPLILDMMAKRYWAMLRVKSMISRHREVGELAEALNMQTWNLKKLIDQAKNFSEPSLREGVFKCHQADLAIKRSQGPKKILMEKLLIDLCRPNKSPSPTFRKGG
jgi:DNA polymerase-3 subunit delta